ncbi:hypothetical protein [Kitasatospora sp. NBC_01300]|uniref:hypothetical protein n=1 Tax=Kitasatospora sp. NBC_01300 TaxID=2903574 RepID=UPI002F911F80|nr:hypothetical protein OG556_40415 [Kitasatospora sp. NBC_01300]
MLASALLRRIRATAGPGPVNATDAWSTGDTLRVEATNGPPCEELVSLLTGQTCGPGWTLDHAWCTCQQDKTGCTLDFVVPATGQRLAYGNGHWGRTMDERRLDDVAGLNGWAFG